MLQRAWKKLQWSVAQRGLWGTLRVALRKAAPEAAAHGPVEHIFDREFGVDTSGFVGAWELGGGGPHERFSNPYYGVPPSRLREALRRWKEDLVARGMAVEAFAFVDIGCGKGRAMMIASEMPFREVMGVELGPGLVAVARANLKRWEELGRRKSPVRVEQGDATAAALPEGPWLFFLYNSFQAPVMRTMMERLEALAEQSGRPMYLLYVVPQQEAVLAEFPRFKRVWDDVIELSDEEKAVDMVSSPEDRCSLYSR